MTNKDIRIPIKGIKIKGVIMVPSVAPIVLSA